MSLAKLMIETSHSDLLQIYFPKDVPPNVQPPVIAQPIPCNAMMNPYDKDFPHLKRKFDENTRVFARPYVIPNTVNSQEHYQSSASDEVLNW